MSTSVVSRELSPIAGKTFVITGKLSKVRNEFKAVILAMNGRFSTEVNSKTDYLIVGRNNKETTKLIKAMEMETQIINEKEFYELINQ